MVNILVQYFPSSSVRGISHSMNSRSLNPFEFSCRYNRKVSNISWHLLASSLQRKRKERKKKKRMKDSPYPINFTLSL